VLAPIVKHFINNTHILYVDACHTAEKWIIMVACFMDGNHCVQPISFYITKGEFTSYWTIFLTKLKLAGITQLSAPDLVIYSDQGRGLGKAIEKVFGWCEHTLCAVHRERHFQEEWKKAHGDLSIENIAGIEAFNSIIKYYRNARISGTWDECLRWLNLAATTEVAYCSQHPCRKVGT